MHLPNATKGPFAKPEGRRDGFSIHFLKTGRLSDDDMAVIGGTMRAANNLQSSGGQAWVRYPYSKHCA